MLEQPEFQVVYMKIFFLTKAVIVESLHRLRPALCQGFLQPETKASTICDEVSSRIVRE